MDLQIPQAIGNALQHLNLGITDFFFTLVGCERQLMEFSMECVIVHRKIDPARGKGIESALGVN